MNTKLYKEVVQYAKDLMSAAEKDDEQVFYSLYEELKALCVENENIERKNHPVQWETLADFTENSGQALTYYKKSLGYAEEIKAQDYIASINYAMANLYNSNNVFVSPDTTSFLL